VGSGGTSLGGSGGGVGVGVAGGGGGASFAVSVGNVGGLLGNVELAVVDVVVEVGL
jgi:hypothetical protein